MKKEKRKFQVGSKKINKERNKKVFYKALKKKKSIKRPFTTTQILKLYFF